MTTMISKYSFRSASKRPVFLILLVIMLLIAPASAFASSDDDQTSDSTTTTEQTSPTNQSGSFEGSAPTVQFESPADYEQDTTTDFSAGLANDDPGSDNPDSGFNEPDSSNEVDTTSGEQELAPPEAGVSDTDDSTDVNDNNALETPLPSSQPDEQSELAEVNASSETETGSEGETDDLGDNGPIDGQDLPTLETEEALVGDTVAGEATSNATSYFQVQEVSMSPLLNPGSIVEVTSETYADGDMVVAQKSDGTYIVKILDGDQLVPLGAGTSYPVADVTILGAANLSSMTAESLEQSGLTWHTVLAQTAVKPAGSGTLEDPFLIASLENLFWITAPNDVVTELTQAQRWYANKNYKQTDNIDASVTSTWYSGAGWLPIGNSGTKFRGTYNGQGFTISGLFINRPADNYISLFGDAGSDAVLQNIKLENVDITGKDQVGGLSGKNSKGEIVNCYVTGSVSGEEAVGGLVGENDILGKISNSYTTGSVTGVFIVGGLTGINQGKIKNSYSSANVSGSSNYVGGLVGQNCYNDSATITDSYATGNVTGADHVGGLVGYNQEGKVTNSYATGTVEGNDNIGGLVGYNFGASSEISNSYATGTVTGTGDDVGGLVGYNYGYIKNSYATFAVEDAELDGLVGDNPLDTVDDKSSIKTLAGILTLAFHQDILEWDITGQDGFYPKLGWEVNWSANTWYMGTPPTPDNTSGGFGFFDFGFPPGLVLLAQNGSGLTTITGQGNAPITPGIIASGSWNDLNQAVAAYQAALASLENNSTTLSPAELALLEVELAIVRAAILALEAKLLAADGKPFNLANLQAAYAAAVATVTANQSAMSAEQIAAANQLLTVIAGVIATLQQMNA